MNTHDIEARMLAKAKQEVVSGSTWLTLEDVSKLSKFHSTNSPEIWLKQNRIFAFEYNGKALFPLYALDSSKNYLPYQYLREIILILEKDKDSWGIALWFSGLCGLLGGKRPQDILISHHELVLTAAKDEIAGVTHG